MSTDNTTKWASHEANAALAPQLIIRRSGAMHCDEAVVLGVSCSADDGLMESLMTLHGEEAEPAHNSQAPNSMLSACP